MTEEEPNSERDKADAMSPTVQLRLWRRVWVIVAVFVLLAPVMLWVVIDQAGKAEWREVQARLRAKGEATTIEELNLPTREEVPDEDNFCAIPVFTETGSSVETETDRRVEAALAPFQRGALTSEHTGAPEYPARPSFYLGQSVDLRAWRRYLDAVAIFALRDTDADNGRSIPSFPVRTGVDDFDVVSDYLTHADSVWGELEGALERPHAYFLPLMFEGWKQGDSPLAASLFPQSGVLLKLNQPLSLRIAAACRTGDVRTALTSLTIQLRTVEAMLNEPSFVRYILAVAFSSTAIENTARCLWSEEFRADETQLAELQNLLSRIDFLQGALNAFRRDMAIDLEGIQWMKHHRNEAVSAYKMLGNSNWETIAARIMPPGWFDANSAYLGDLYDRTFLQAFRDQQMIGPMLRAARSFESEFTSFNAVKKFFYVPAGMMSPPYEKVMNRVQEVETIRRQTLVVIATYRYQLASAGLLPDSLNELVPDYLATIPLDPFAGEPMRYTLEPNAEGGFRLWSVGPDGRDDGGKLDRIQAMHDNSGVFRKSYAGDISFPLSPEKPSSTEG